MAQESIFIGSYDNDPAADSLRVAFGKCNHNFTELYSTVASSGVTSVAITMPTGFTVNGSPITSTGTFAITTALSGVIKGTGSGFAAAVPDTDYLTPTGSGAGLTGITKSQVGLGNVENTALSTWTGSSNISTVGTINTGAWQGNSIDVIRGGTGQSSYTQGDLLYADTSSSLAKLAKNSSSSRYLSNTGLNNNPAWAQVSLSDGVSGILPEANGGAGAINGILKANGSGLTTAATAGTDYLNPATGFTRVAAPLTAVSTGTAGQMAFDSGFLYVCTATDTWVRTALTTW